MAELSVISSKDKKYQVNLAKNGNEGMLNDEKFSWDVVEESPRSFHVIKGNKSFNVEVLAVDFNEKTCVVKVNGEKHSYTVKDRFDELLHSLGLDDLASTKVADLKAPMPGLVLSISVGEGQQVSKGDSLLILEAMKMENVIKSPADGVIKSISVDQGQTVEKNQLILNFE